MGANGEEREDDNMNGKPNVFQPFGERDSYHVYIDPRYDLEWLKAEIEARIKIGELPGG